MTNDRQERAERAPSDEPAMDPLAAREATDDDAFDTAGYGEDYAAVETDSNLHEVQSAWQEARKDIDQEDLRLMDPADRLEPDRDPREGE